MKNLLQTTEYKDFIHDIKSRIKSSQVKAAVSVNESLLRLYWYLGERIIEKQRNTKWGDGLISQMSNDLNKTFPNMKGFSLTNIKYMRQWVLFYSNGQQPVGQFNQDKLGLTHNELKSQGLLSQQAVDPLDGSVQKPQFIEQNRQQIVEQIYQIPWGHNIAIISKVKEFNEAHFYVNQTKANNWSRAILVHQIESNLYLRKGKAITNFDKTLPAPQSDLAQQLIKDPYTFDFLTLGDPYNEIELEKALLDHVAKFLLELGSGFSYIGRQYRIEVEGDEFFMDLLFYHVKLHCYVVIDLKTGKFTPEHAGKINFYVSALDEQIKSEEDNPTIGILICKSKNNTVVDFAIKDIRKPIGVSEYILTKELPKKLKDSLPTIYQIQAELGKNRTQ